MCAKCYDAEGAGCLPSACCLLTNYSSLEELESGACPVPYAAWRQHASAQGPALRREGGSSDFTRPPEQTPEAIGSEGERANWLARSEQWNAERRATHKDSFSLRFPHASRSSNSLTVYLVWDSLLAQQQPLLRSASELSIQEVIITLVWELKSRHAPALTPFARRLSPLGINY